MNTSLIVENWALWAAGLPVAIVVFAIMIVLYRKSPRGQLSRARRNYRAAEKTLTNACRSTRAAARRLEKLEGRAEKVRPRTLQEAREALEDSRALEKIADDKAQVMMNHLRRVIFEEYPPAKHEQMRAKYLPQDVADGRPFSF